MALFNVAPKPVTSVGVKSDGVADKIKRRRYQILVHSLLYYELDINLVTDQQWSDWAAELVQLQEQNPEVASSIIFADEFKLFDGSSGFDLPYRDEQIVNIAYRLLKAAEARGDSNVDDALITICRVKSTPAHYSGFKQNGKFKSTKKAVKKDEPKRKKLF